MPNVNAPAAPAEDSRYARGLACLAVAQWPVTPRDKTDRQKLRAMAVEHLGRARGNG